MRWVLIAVACGSGAVLAAEPDTDKTHRFPSKAVNTMERAGNPQQISCLAMPGRTPCYTAGYTGGGIFRFTSKHQDPRDLMQDGTWGSDYTLFGKFPGRIFLGWAHDRKHQPPRGDYTTDGRHVPDPIALHPIQKLLTGRKSEKSQNGEHE